MAIGQTVKKIQSALAPAFELFASIAVPIVEKVTDGIKWLFDAIKEGNPWVRGFAIGIGAVATAVYLYNTYTKAAAFLTGLWKTEEGALTVAAWKTNLAFLANPVVLVITGIIAAIAWCILYVRGWGEAWHHVTAGVTLLFKAFVADLKLQWTGLVDGLMAGLDLIKMGWYEFCNAVGIGGKKKNDAALDAIAADVDKQKKKVIDGTNEVRDLAMAAAMELGAIRLTIGGEKEEEKSDDLGVNAKGAKNKKATAALGTATNNAIASGGQKNTTINVTIGNLVSGGIKTVVNDTQEALDGLNDKIINVVTRAVAIGAAMGTT
jgi:hypothetical protein